MSSCFPHESLAPPGRSLERLRTAPEARAARFREVIATGSPADVGAAIGAASRDAIATCVERRRGWFEDLRAFALADRTSRLEPFARATRERHPAVWAEVEGLARGAGLELDDVLVLNLQPELSALKAKVVCGDCSTLLLEDGRRVLIAHNEDDDDAYRDHMLLVRVRPDGAPAFVSLAYPGVIPGNVPAMTAAGIVRTTNFIGAKAVLPGVPRHVLGRAVLAARTLDEAVAVACDSAGAYSFCLHLGSTRERRLVTLEVAPGGVHDAREVRAEIGMHTNHFVLPRTRRVPQMEASVGSSTQSRHRVLSSLLASAPAPACATAGDLVAMLSSHESVTVPYSPCRHPSGAVTGRTVALALFDLVAETFTLWEGNPCEGRVRSVAPP
jgi:hypothetical protein